MEIQQPAPVDVSRLKNILGGAKKLMNKVETGDYETGHINSMALTEDGVQQLYAEGVTRPVTQTSASVGYTEEMVRNSHLPPAIKEAMIKKPIQQLSSLTHTFNLEDVADLAEKPMGPPKRPVTTPRRTITESVNDDLITISKAELETLIDGRLLEFFTKTYNKMITEATIKQTISTLVKEGKLSVKKKLV